MKEGLSRERHRLMLSPRQYEVAYLVAEGKSNKAVAKALGLSVKTVEVYVQQAATRIGGEGSCRVRIIRWFYSSLPTRQSPN